MGVGDVTPNRRGARSRESVLDAAERVMATHGYAGASMTLIIEEAGIPASSIYHYFGSKDGVLLAVMERGSERFFSLIPNLGELIGTPQQHMSFAVDAVRRALEANPDFLRLLITIAALPPSGIGTDARAVVAQVRGEARNRLRAQYALVFSAAAGSADADQFADFALAIVDGAFVASQADPGHDLATVLDCLPVVARAIHDSRHVRRGA